MAKASVSKIGVRSATKRTLKFGLLNLGISLAPAVDADARIKARQLDPELGTPVSMAWMNKAGAMRTTAELVKGYEYGDKFVIFDEGELPKMESEDTIELVANLATHEVPAEWVEKTQLAWPQDETHNEVFALVADYLREAGRVFVGTTVANGTSKVFAIRWSHTYGIVVAQQLTYHATVRWGNIDTIKDAIEALPPVAPAMATMAGQLFDAMPDEFAWEDVTDEYGERLADAVRQKGESGKVTAAAPTAAEAPAVPDLQAALAASLAAMPPKAKGKTKAKA